MTCMYMYMYIIIKMCILLLQDITPVLEKDANEVLQLCSDEKQVLKY